MADRRINRQSAQLNRQVELGRLQAPGITGMTEEANSAMQLAGALGGVNSIFGSIGSMIQQREASRREQELEDIRAGQTAERLGEERQEGESEAFIKGRNQQWGTSDGLSIKKLGEEFLQANIDAESNADFQASFQEFKQTHLQGMDQLPEEYREKFAKYWDDTERRIVNAWENEEHRRDIEQMRITTTHAVDAGLDDILSKDLTPEQRTAEIKAYEQELHSNKSGAMDKRLYKKLINDLFAGKLIDYAKENNDRSVLDYKDIGDKDGITVELSDPALKAAFEKADKELEGISKSETFKAVKNETALFEGKVNQLTKSFNEEMDIIKKMVDDPVQGITAERALGMSERATQKYKLKMEDEREAYKEYVQGQDLSPAEERAFIARFDEKAEYGQLVAEQMTKQIAEDKASKELDAKIAFQDARIAEPNRVFRSDEMEAMGMSKKDIAAEQNAQIAIAKNKLKQAGDKIGASVEAKGNQRIADDIRKALRGMTPFDSQLKFNALLNTAMQKVTNAKLRDDLVQAIKKRRDRESDLKGINEWLDDRSKALDETLAGAEVEGTGIIDDTDFTDQQKLNARWNIEDKIREAYTEARSKGKTQVEALREAEQFGTGLFRNLEDDLDTWATKYLTPQTSVKEDPDKFALTEAHHHYILLDGKVVIWDSKLNKVIDNNPKMK